MSIAGHVSRKMLEHYSHIRLDAKRKALEALSNRPQRMEEQGGYGTKDTTIGLSESSTSTQVLEKMVDGTGLEPATSSLRTRRSPMLS